MGEHQVVLADVLVVVVDVVLELGAVPGEVVPGSGHGHDVDVHEVGAAAHHAEGGAGPVAHHHAAGVQVLLGARRDEGRSHAVAGGGRDVGHLVADGRVVLHIVHTGQRLHAAPQRRVGGDVLDPLAVQVDLRPVLLHVGDVLRPGPGWHGAAPCRLATVALGNGITAGAGVIPNCLNQDRSYAVGEDAPPVIPAKAGIQRAYYGGIRKAGNGFGPGFLPSQE